MPCFGCFLVERHQQATPTTSSSCKSKQHRHGATAALPAAHRARGDPDAPRGRGVETVRPLATSWPEGNTNRASARLRPGSRSLRRPAPPNGGGSDVRRACAMPGRGFSSRRPPKSADDRRNVSHLCSAPHNVVQCHNRRRRAVLSRAHAVSPSLHIAFVSACSRSRTAVCQPRPSARRRLVRRRSLVRWFVHRRHATHARRRVRLRRRLARPMTPRMRP